MKMRNVLIGLLLVSMALPLAAADITGDDEPCDDNGDIHYHRYCYSIPGGTILQQLLDIHRIA